MSEPQKSVLDQDKQQQSLDIWGRFPPGHFYSPIPSLSEVNRDEAKIFPPLKRVVAGIDLREDAQLDLLSSFADFYSEMPFTEDRKEGSRYYFNNPAYSYSDAIMLYSMLRYKRPRRYIEIGSGFSSCAAIDTSDKFLGGSVAMTFIEPYPSLLHDLLLEGDVSRVSVIPQRLQDVDIGVFEALEKNDILFIDSTHVSKVGSDVNRIFFEILPCLKPGVVVHIHDVFFPFEYPKVWIFEGRAWNEIYMLRTFLQYNSRFQILLMNTFMEHFHRPFFEAKMPLCLLNLGGSIWIEKT